MTFSLGRVREVWSVEKRRLNRSFGIGLWIGSFCALTLFAVNYARFGHIPGLAQRMLIGEGTIALVGAAVGYLCWIGFFLKD